ncbi:MAG: malonyl-ACP O-methyltransferase BioC [Methylococcaceae bacterium]|jgi:malonyl-CoA O-methyltransferase
MRGSADLKSAKGLIARSFGAAAHSYDGVASLQRAAGQLLLDQWSQGSGSVGVERMLDVGAGTGFIAAALADCHPAAQVMALDLSEGMLKVARDRFSGVCIVGDAEALPFSDHSIDVVFSNMAIQWCPRAEDVFREFGRVLRPYGRLLFTTLGPATLRELRAAWASVDDRSHVNDFTSADDIDWALTRAGFHNRTVTTAISHLEYADVMGLMRGLKQLGAHNLTPGRTRHLTGKGTLRRVMDAYPGHMLGRPVLASFEVVTGVARKECERGSDNSAG